jgi:uncharacterized protein (DUF488 family)
MMLLTYGHGTEKADRTAALLADAGVVSLVDIRTAPGSKRHPQFARAAMEQWLPAAGIGYRWEKRLGGFRTPGHDNPDVTWREPMFRGYAEHMRGTDFRDAIDALLTDAGLIDTGLIDTGLIDTGLTDMGLAETAVGQVAVMCSESLWWRCHRRLLADFVALARGAEVRHLMHDGSAEAHRPSPGVRLRADGLLVYDAGQDTLM